MPELNEILVDLQIAFGYKNVNKKGTCQGFEMMGLLAFLARDEHGNHQLPAFHARNNYIKSHLNFANEIKPVLKKLETRNKILDKNKVLTPEEEQKFNLSEEEKELYDRYIDIRAYLDGMRLCQKPSTFHYLFGEMLSQSNIVQASQFAQSLAVESQQGYVLIGSIVGVYRVAELTEMIGQLRHLLNQNQQDGIFSIGSSFHAIGVCYDSQKKEWHQINANKHHLPYPALNPAFPSVLDKVMAEFICLESEIESKVVLDENPNRLFLLGFDIIASHANALAMQAVFHTFQQTAAYTNAQTITEEKAEYKNKKKFTLLDMAIRHKELQTIVGLRVIDENKKDKKILNLASLTNSPQVIDTLGKDGVDLNQELLPLNFGMIAHEAAKRGNLEMLRVIDQHQGDLFKKDLLRRTPLDLAKKHQRTETVKFLESVKRRNKLLAKIKDATQFSEDPSFKKAILKIEKKVVRRWRRGELDASSFESLLQKLEHLLNDIKYQSVQKSSSLGLFNQENERRHSITLDEEEDTTEVKTTGFNTPPQQKV